MKLRIVYKDGSFGEIECMGSVKVSQYTQKIFIEQVPDIPIGVNKLTISPSQFKNIKSITVVLDD